MSPSVLTFTAALSGDSFTDGDLQDWVDQIAQTAQVVNPCIVVLHDRSRPESPTNTSRHNPYHSSTSNGTPYCFCLVFGENLSVADNNHLINGRPTEKVYAHILSHEVAEMVVDRLAGLNKPKDPVMPVRATATTTCAPDRLAGSGVLAGLLPYVGPDSKLWPQIKRAIASLEPATSRVETLTEFVQPKLDGTMYAWMRRQFDSDAPLARDTARTDFLASIAKHEAGAIDYVLDRAASAPVNAELARAMLENPGETPYKTVSCVADLVRSHREAFIEAAEVLTAMADRSVARQGLSALEAAIPELEESAEALLCASAVSHGWAAQGEMEKARALARRCLDLIPPVPDDDTMRLFWASSYVEAAGRLLLAAAPFADLWRYTVPVARDLEARGTGTSHRSDALARSLGAVPWIANPVERLDWLSAMLAAIDEFIESDLDKELADPMDMSLRLSTIMGGDPIREQLSRPIEQALRELLDQIDRIVPSPKELQPFLMIVSTAINVRSRYENDSDPRLDMLRQFLASAARSTNLNVRVLAAEVFIQTAAQNPEPDAAVVLAEALVPLTSNVDDRTARVVADGALTSADRAWCTHKPEMCSALAYAALTAAVQAHDVRLFEIAEMHMEGWIRRGDPGVTEELIVTWAAARVAFGRVEEGTRMLEGVDTTDWQKRLDVAKVFVDSGANDVAAQLLEPDLPAAGERASRESLQVARLLLRANGDPRARGLLLRPVLEYRASTDDEDGDTESTLLNALFDVRDDAIVKQLLTSAEDELLQSAEPDADLAARWYVTVALSATGNLEATKKAWRQIAQWKTRRLEIAARDRTIALLRDPANVPAVDGLLDAIRAMGEPEEALSRACRLLQHLSDDARLRLIEGIAELADERVLTTLCESLAQISNGPAVQAGIARVIDALPRLAPVGTALLEALFAAARAHAVDLRDSWRLLLPLANAALFREALAMGADLQLATEVAGERWEFLMSIAEFARVEEVIDRLVAIADPAEPVRLAALFKLGNAAEVEARLRSAGPPATASARVQWASELTGTPLESYANASLDELLENLDRFATPNDLRSLGAFLRKAGAFEKVTNWAANMPLVTNEDWRHMAFIDIVKATGDLDPSVRSGIQRHALERGFTLMNQYGRRSFAEALVSFPLDTDTARWALDLVTTDLDEIVDLLVAGHRSENANEAVLDAYLQRIGDRYPSSLKREAAARAASQTTYQPLRDRLAAILLRDYDARGAGKLERPDLEFLASMPLAWWIEHSTMIGVDQPDERSLCEWIERVVHAWPDSAWWAVTLATEWLSRDDPDAVRDFWVELCMLPPWFPDETRRLILHSTL